MCVCICTLPFVHDSFNFSTGTLQMFLIKEKINLHTFYYACDWALFLLHILQLILKMIESMLISVLSSSLLLIVYLYLKSASLILEAEYFGGKNSLWRHENLFPNSLYVIYLCVILGMLCLTSLRYIFLIFKIEIILVSKEYYKVT